MKLLLDQNMSRHLVRLLGVEYPDSIHVGAAGLAEADDYAIWQHAGAHGYVLVSKDNDFRQLAFLHGPPPKVVWLRVGNVDTTAIDELLRLSAERLAVFVASQDESLLVLSSAD